MSFKKIGLVLLVVLFLFPLAKTIAQNSNAGFPSSNIWYSEDPLQEGDKVKIYTLVYNPDDRQLSGTIFFFDHTTFLGNRDFVVPTKSSTNISIDWTVTAGDHTIFAQIQNPKFLTANGTYVKATLIDIKSDESKTAVAKKITAPTETATGTVSNNNDTRVISAIKNGTPEIVTKTIDNTVGTLENLRNNIDTTSNQNKKETQAKLAVLQSKNAIAETAKKDSAQKITPTNPQNSNTLTKPFLYVKLFFLSLVAFIFGSKLLFYTLLILIVFFILRFLWRLIF